MSTKEEKARFLVSNARNQGLGITDMAGAMGGELPEDLVTVLEEKMIEIYMKHYSEEEMDLSIKLQSDPTYVEMNKKLPAFAQETMKAAMELSMEYFMKSGMKKPFLH